MPVVRFPGTRYAPLTLPPGALLARTLTAVNSPVLFGCRTGLCGTCVVAVEGEIPPPDDDEREVLAIVAPDEPRARLACQIDLVADVHISEIG
jgi:ferredoxin